MFLLLSAIVPSAFTAFGQQTGYVLHPDPRYKADILVVVAHPDDETAIGSYLARAVFDEHKKVAVIFGTRGNSGGNAYGDQQAASLGLIREIEARRALAVFGIMNVWFLDGPDTPSQDVLHSLETWNHGRCLDQVTRIVRLTRPEIIMTWLPDYAAGENHGDHQAASVLANEAFDIAGDPTQYPEQVTAPRFPTGISNWTEGLQTWQPQKLYFFTDSAHLDFVKGQGPSYDASEISPSKHVSYAHLAAEECSFHLTQSDSGAMAKRALDKNEVDKTYLAEPARLIFGKAEVPSSKTGDVFEGVTDQIPFHRARISQVPDTPLQLEPGGPWHFYPEFWAAHELEHLNGLLPLEVQAAVSQPVTIAVRLFNPEPQPLEGRIEVDAPPGWKVDYGAGTFHVTGASLWSTHIVLIPNAMTAPMGAQSGDEWKQVRISASTGTKSLGEVRVRVQVLHDVIPQ